MTMAVPQGSAECLKARFDAMLERIGALEQDPAFSLAPEQQLYERQVTILRRIERLGQALGLPQASSSTPSIAAPAAAAAKPRPCVTADASPTQQRLERELIDRGLTEFSFVRVPSDYYNQKLEFRRGCLNAPSIHHLCKSVVMVNTRAHESTQSFDDPTTSKYYLVVVQYTARLHSDKLKAAVMKLHGNKLPSKHYNIRLAPEEDNDRLTGFSHNAVSPVGLKERVPILLSHRIAQLSPAMFWMGGGEVDLKLGVRLDEFVAGYAPAVVDCTYDTELSTGDEAVND